ncbi:hypothetical protein [Cytobacillus firmus]|nr:hypothetical protein [Cytobacillus firmus]MBG9546893.1 hypothetical protein [Cytobacillus firmus]MBG9602122.1 hypothetical protein [Cytobacillus firmus]
MGSTLDVDPTDNGAVVSNATASVSVSGKDLIITVVPGESNWSTVTGASTVNVKTLPANDDVKDANGVLVKDNVSVTLQK